GIRLEPTWLEELARAVERDPETEVVYGNFEPVTDSAFKRYAALAYVPPKLERPEGVARGPFIASTLLRRGVWEAVGGFPDLRAAEDLIFIERIEAAGFRVRWAPRAMVWWDIQPTLGRTFRRFVLYSKHNVWAGRQGHWHYGVARQYAVAALLVALAVAHSPWWLAPLALGFAARVGRSL